jgi:hypothetical protein
MKQVFDNENGEIVYEYDRQGELYCITNGENEIGPIQFDYWRDKIIAFINSDCLQGFPTNAMLPNIVFFLNVEDNCNYHLYFIKVGEDEVEVTFEFEFSFKKKDKKQIEVIERLKEYLVFLNDTEKNVIHVHHRIKKTSAYLKMVFTADDCKYLTEAKIIADKFYEDIQVYSEWSDIDVMHLTKE